MTKKETISAVVITKNEEFRISKCLDSVKWADEIIVIDDFSVDKTIDVCRRYTDKVFQNRLDNDFARQRNLGIEKVSSDWVLQLDADEIVPIDLKNEIEDKINSSGEFTGYNIRRKNFFLGHFMRYGGWHQGYQLKLFRKDKGRNTGRVHEVIQLDGNVGTFSSEIEHRPFNKVSDCIDSLNHYTTIEAEELLKAQGDVGKARIKYNLTIKPLKIFYKIYVKKHGFREGRIGLIFSFFWALGFFMRWAKYMEKMRGLK